jgi:hypothetical protein
MTYLYRASPQAPRVPHRPQVHGYACDYIGGDAGVEVVAEEYWLHLDLGQTAVFLHRPSGKFHAATRIGEPTVCPVGDDWRQGQAHIVLATDVMHTEHLVGEMGPFSFYDLLCELVGGPVTPREAIADGYFGDAVFNLRGHALLLPCDTPEEALELLAIACAPSASPPD